MLFPSITASGIPKNAALNAIMQIEDAARLYSGAILLLDDMRFDAALVLRSVFQDSQRCWIQAGRESSRNLHGTRTDGNPGEISEHCALFNGVGVTVF